MKHCLKKQKNKKKNYLKNTFSTYVLIFSPGVLPRSNSKQPINFSLKHGKETISMYLEMYILGGSWEKQFADDLLIYLVISNIFNRGSAHNFDLFFHWGIY